MNYSLQLLFQTSLRFFFLFGPFFALSMFLYLTKDFTDKQRKKDATKIGLFAFFFCVAIIFFGKEIFSILGITLEAFRVGVGTMLLLDAISLVKGKTIPAQSDNQSDDIAIVPMTIPIIVGPAVIGTMLVIGTDTPTLNDKLFNILALFITSIIMWLMLYLSTTIERYIGKKKLNILSKMTGIYLGALASQMIMQGVRDGCLLSK